MSTESNCEETDITAMIGRWSPRTQAVLGLGLLVALVVAGHWVAQRPDEELAQYAARIQLVQRQATGSQRIAKLALGIQAAQPGPIRERLLAELDQFLRHWDRAHDYVRGTQVDGALVHGGPLFGPPGRHSPEVEAMYCELQPAQFGLLRSAQELVNEFRYPQSGPPPRYRPMDDVLRFERENLDAIERLVVQYQREARERVANRQMIAKMWLALTVGLLAFSGWIVLLPVLKQLDQAARRLGQLRGELLAARQMAAAVGADHKRLVGALQNDVRPALGTILTACDCAAEHSDSPTARQQLSLIDATGRRLFRRLNDLVPSRADVHSLEPATRQLAIAVLETPQPSLYQESELLACSATQNR
jgi:hypothetical protein